MICIWVCFASQVVSYSLAETLPGITSVGRRGEGREGKRDKEETEHIRPTLYFRVLRKKTGLTVEFI